MAWVKDLFVAHDRDARVATNRKSYPYCALHTPKLGHPYPSAAPCRILGEAAIDLLERQTQLEDPHTEVLQVTNCYGIERRRKRSESAGCFLAGVVQHVSGVRRVVPAASLTLA